MVCIVNRKHTTIGIELTLSGPEAASVVTAILSRVIDSSLVAVESATTSFRWLRLMCGMTQRNKLIGRSTRHLLSTVTKKP